MTRMGRIGGRSAEKCLIGGIAAGRVACSIDDLYALRYSDPGEISRKGIVGHFTEAARYAKGLRNFPAARSAAVDLEKTLKNSGKAFAKGEKTLTAEEAKLLRRTVLDAKAALRGILSVGLSSCGLRHESPSAAATALDDYSFWDKELKNEV